MKIGYYTRIRRGMSRGQIHNIRAHRISRAFSPWAKRGQRRHFLKVW